jgi:hypothetical protein
MGDYNGDPFALLQYMTNTPQSGVQGKTDDMQNLLSLIMNPQYGVAQGSYDYMQSVPPQEEQYSTPTLSSFLNSASPVWRLVAEKIMNGTIDPIVAMGEIQNTLQYTEVPNEDGIDIAAARGYVDQMFAEVDGMKKTQDSNAKAYETWLSNTPYAKAGLPQPTEDYTFNTVPQSEATRRAYFDYMNSQARMGVDDRPMNRRGGEYDKQYAEMFARKKKEDTRLGDRYKSILMADLQTALNAGRTPLSDALNARSSGINF